MQAGVQRVSELAHEPFSRFYT